MCVCDIRLHRFEGINQFMTCNSVFLVLTERSLIITPQLILVKIMLLLNKKTYRICGKFGVHKNTLCFYTLSMVLYNDFKLKCGKNIKPRIPNKSL